MAEEEVRTGLASLRELMTSGDKENRLLFEQLTNESELAASKTQDLVNGFQAQFVRIENMLGTVTLQSNEVSQAMERVLETTNFAIESLYIMHSLFQSDEQDKRSI